MSTVLLVGGDLCTRTARILSNANWTCIGLRRNPVRSDSSSFVTWYQADLQDPRSLVFLGDPAFSDISHILYAPSPDGRTAAHYSGVYPTGLKTLLSSLDPSCLGKLRRCVLVGSSVVWAPSDDWVTEGLYPIKGGRAFIKHG